MCGKRRKFTLDCFQYKCLHSQCGALKLHSIHEEKAHVTTLKRFCIFKMCSKFIMRSFWGRYFTRYSPYQMNSNLESNADKKSLVYLFSKTSKTTFNNDQPRSGKEKDLWLETLWKKVNCLKGKSKKETSACPWVPMYVSLIQQCSAEV